MRNLVLLFLFIPFIGVSQGPSIKLNANFEKIETDSKIIITTVTVEKNGTIEHTSVTQNGRFKYKLEKDALYKIYFSKVNHRTKFVLVDTRDIPKPNFWHKRQNLRLTMTYFLDLEDNKFDFLDTTPISIAKYDEQYKRIRWDYSYSNLINEKIAKILYPI